MNPISDYRRFYAEFIVKRAGSSDARLIEAFAAVPREDYLGAGPWQVFVGSGYIPTISNDPRLLYQDILIGIAPGRGINNGQPSLHADCLAATCVTPGETVVHIGAGSGYYTAVLATLIGPLGSVIAIEREKDLAARARAALRHFPNVKVRSESAIETEIPACDVVYINAGATHPPASWLDALRIGGRLVFPLTANNGVGAMLMVTRQREAYAARAICRAAFIPCIGARDDATSTSLSAALERQSLKEIRSLKRDIPPDGSAWCAGNNWWLSSAEA